MIMNKEAMMPRMNAFVELAIPEAIAYGDYVGIQNDLRTAKTFIELLNFDYPPEIQVRGIMDGLTTAIIIRYCRAFDGLRTSWWREGLECLTDEEKTMHAHIKTIRDRHIAHSVNDYEENRPHARYWTDTVEQEGFIDIGCNHSRVIALSGHEISSLIKIIDKLTAFLEIRITNERTQLLEVVRQQPIKEVLKQGNRPLADLSDPMRKRQRPR